MAQAVPPEGKSPEEKRNQGEQPQPEGAGREEPTAEAHAVPHGQPTGVPAGAGYEYPKRLYRSRTNRIIGGVAGGIGEFFNIDPTLVRVLFVLLAFAGGAGVIAYLVALIIIPERPEGEAAPGTAAPTEGVGVSNEIALVLGLILVALGVWYLLSNLSLVPPQLFFFWTFVRRAFWPIVLILVGAIVIASARRGGQVGVSFQGKTLHRSRTNRRIAGVAGGIGEYFGVDPTLIRIAWVVLGIINPPATLLAYIVAAIVIPEEPVGETR